MDDLYFKEILIVQVFFRLVHETQGKQFKRPTDEFIRSKCITIRRARKFSFMDTLKNSPNILDILLYITLTSKFKEKHF